MWRRQLFVFLSTHTMRTCAIYNPNHLNWNYTNHTQTCFKNNNPRTLSIKGYFVDILGCTKDLYFQTFCRLPTLHENTVIISCRKKWSRQLLATSDTIIQKWVSWKWHTVLSHYAVYVFCDSSVSLSCCAWYYRLWLIFLNYYLKDIRKWNHSIYIDTN